MASFDQKVATFDQKVATFDQKVATFDPIWVGIKFLKILHNLETFSRLIYDLKSIYF